MVTLPISVVIVNYNSDIYLTQCIASIVDCVFEVIVVDNGSQDSSIEHCKKYFSNRDNLQIVDNHVNFGFSHACNQGVRFCNTQFILFLNPDCLLEGQDITILFELLSSNIGAAMVGGLLLNPNGTEQGGARRAIPTPWRSFVRGFGLYRLAPFFPQIFFDFHLHNQPLPPAPIEVEAISGACMLVRRNILEDIGLWDEGYFLHCEDLDLCVRIREEGWKILFTPEARIEHQQGVCSNKRPAFVEWHKHRGMIRFYRKFFSSHYPFFLMWLVVLAVWLRFTIVVVIKSFKNIFLKNSYQPEQLIHRDE